MTAPAKPALGRLHVITDEVLQSRFTHAEMARLAVAGGADTVQYREKRPFLTSELVEVALAVADACRAGHATCIVDDRIDVTAAVHAAGVHLGRYDIAVGVARSLLGASYLVGGTANSIEEARTVFATPVDYVGIGPIFGTNSKANPAPVMGLETLAAIVAESPVPVIAIGNITVESVSDVLATGAYGIAVLSGITCAANPTEAATGYARAIARFLEERGSA